MGRFRPHKMYPGALLAQEACTYQATCELLAALRGDLVVLVHSDRDCSNVLPKTRGRIIRHHDYKFLCTNLSEDEMVTGQGNAKLRRAIELIHERWQPELLVVLSTCPTVMIGDNIKNVTRKTAKQLGMRAVAQITHGLKPKSPAEVVDKLYTTLCRTAAPAQGDVSRRVNLVGIGMDRRVDASKRAGSVTDRQRPQSIGALTIPGQQRDQRVVIVVGARRSGTRTREHAAFDRDGMERVEPFVDLQLVAHGSRTITSRSHHLQVLVARLPLGHEFLFR